MPLPSLVQSRSTSGTGNLSLAFSSPITALNSIIVVVGENTGSADTFNVTDGHNTYSHLAQIADASGDGLWQVFYVFTSVGGATTVSFTCNNGGGSVLLIHEFSGGLNTLDNAVPNNGTGSTQATGNLTTISATELLFSFTGCVDSTGGDIASILGAGGVWNTAQSIVATNVAAVSQWQAVSSIGTYSATSATTNSGKGSAVHWAAEIAGFYLGASSQSPPRVHVQNGRSGYGPHRNWQGPVG